ncbi:MAG: efflux RND transporter permease subunit [Gemmataceae bacterium]|nr:efflux RND transporter permease subunit [Gemmataceae bacterium]MCI0742458.1 efflux RND transporter permease subunit [Gemmataceae bacterium]
MVTQGSLLSETEASAKQTTWLVRVAVSNPYLVIVLCLFIAVIGFVCVDRVPVDILPTYQSPAVQVLTLYPGMPTEFMDRTITNRIERWTGQAVGIQRQESRTMIGVSVVRDHFSEGTDSNAAFAQVASLASADLYYLPPGTVPPMVMLYDPTAPLPTAYLAASSDVLDETKVYELAYFNVRNMLQGTPGVIAPAVFGGKLRRIYAELDPQELHARNLSFMDVQRAMGQGSPMIPPGRLKLGDEPGIPEFLRHKDVLLAINNMPDKAFELNYMPIKVGNSSSLFSDGRQGSLRQQVDLKAVGGVADRAAIQTNLVRITRAPAWEGKQTVYLPILRRPGSNTIQVVEGVKKSIPTFLDRLPPRAGAKEDDTNPSGLKLDVVADQSVFVRSAVNNLLWEGGLGAVLACLVVLLFIGSFRPMVVIALTIPLSALVAVIGLYFTGHTLNLMTLGGLALVMGRLVDDPIIDIENTFRHLDMGKSPMQAALDSAREIAMPVLVATITTVAVFFPVIFLYGMGKYLFQPLTLSVAFAMFASWLLSRTLSPAYNSYFLKPHQAGTKRFWLFRVCDAGYEQLKAGYAWTLQRAVRARWTVVPASLVLLVGSFGLFPFLGQELFPATDANQIVVNVRFPAGTRIEKSQERISGEIELTGEPSRVSGGMPGRVSAGSVKQKKKTGQGIEDVIIAVIKEKDRKLILSDIGVLYDWPAGYTANAGPMDATILVQLTEAHERSTSSQEYAALLREAFAAHPSFQDTQFSFNTGGMISAALSFGLPAPINVQIRGRNMFKQYEIAKELRERLKTVKGAVDIRIQQAIDYPTVGIELDQQRMADVGVTMQDAAENMLSSTNGSDVLKSLFWLDYESGNHIYMGVTLPLAMINWHNLMLTPIRGKEPHARAQQLQNLVKNIDWNKKTPVEINHEDLARVIDVYVNVEGRDVGSVAADIERLLTQWGGRGQTSGKVSSWLVPNPADPGKALPGYTVQLRGEVSNMRESFESLGFGFLLAVVLIYLIMVAQFRSFLDPFIILFAVPLGLIGVLLILFLTGTTLNIQSFMGVIFMVGIAVTNSILLVEFANRLRAERGLAVWEAAVEAGKIRLRPILMTMLAVIVGLIPLALHEGEATAPLARAVIGGLTVSTALTIFVVPCLYVMFKKQSLPS